MRYVRLLTLLVLGAFIVLVFVDSAEAGEKKKLLLIGQQPDDHPRSTHEYMPAARLLAKCLGDVPNLRITVAQADGEWLNGPDMINKSDAVFVFVSEGGKWIHDDPRRLEALAKLAARGGGFSVLHWGMGTRDAKNIDGFVKLFGACHGGPDRRYKVVETKVEIAASDHPVVTGIKDFSLKEEFYFKLKMAKNGAFVPLLKAKIEGQQETVCWAWRRTDGGRSFGFSGGHFHDNWQRVEYRRLMSQGILWTLKMPIPEAGLKVDVTEMDLKLDP